MLGQVVDMDAFYASVEERDDPALVRSYNFILNRAVCGCQCTLQLYLFVDMCAVQHQDLCKLLGGYCDSTYTILFISYKESAITIYIYSLHKPTYNLIYKSSS